MRATDWVFVAVLAAFLMGPTFAAMWSIARNPVTPWVLTGHRRGLWLALLFVIPFGVSWITAVAYLVWLRPKLMRAARDAAPTT